MKLSREMQLRARVANEAARLMYEEQVKQYFIAKRMAVRRLFGRSGGRRMRYRPSDLPSNGEIREALLALAERAEGDARRQRLFAMRVIALQVMRTLEGFHPRLIGSVSTGHVRRGSDIDLHVFTDSLEPLETRLQAHAFDFGTERVSIWKGGAIREYTHVHVHHEFDVELTVYPLEDMRVRPRSSTDGKPIVRVSPTQLEHLISADHPREWAHYQRTHEIVGLEDALEANREDAPAPGPFDAFLSDDESEDVEDLDALKRDADAVAAWDQDVAWEAPDGWSPPDDWLHA